MTNVMLSSFPPVANNEAKILIVGSMPGEESLRLQQYYAHPRNAFWYIITQLLNCNDEISYEQKIQLLKQSNIALWDVLMSCERVGSLDASIRNASIIINDFATFYATHPKIKAIYFNGTKAEQEYKKRVLPTLAPHLQQIDNYRLPSTSPAMARLTKEEKLQHWSIITQYLNL